MVHLCDNCEFILDLHFQEHVVHLWTKNRKGELSHYPIAFHPKIYIAADDADTQYAYSKARSLTEIANIVISHSNVIKINFVDRYLNSNSGDPVEVLEVELYSYKEFNKTILDLQNQSFNLFNVDINKRQHFFLSTNSYPLCASHIKFKKAKQYSLSDSPFENTYQLPEDSVEIEKIDTLDDISRIDYFIPTLKICFLFLEYHLQGSFPDKNDALKSIKIVERDYINASVEPVDEHIFSSEKMSEREILQGLLTTLSTVDPDMLIVSLGDQFNIDYLTYRAMKNNLTSEFFLGRLPIPHFVRKSVEGSSYMTYGMILHRDPVVYIPGRLHLDYENSFMLSEGKIPGLIDLSRLSGMPPERTSRASIGTVLTGAEYLVNAATYPPTLIPPNKPKGEYFKSSDTLLIADNGGLIYPALPGVYDKVYAIDFTSLYPFIMLKHNIGSETVLCQHDDCKENEPILVPECKYHICNKQISVVARTMNIILKKRVALKSLKKRITDPKIKDRYKGMDSGLKWILVCCFEGSTRVLVRKNGVHLSERLDTIVNEFKDADKLEVVGMNEQGQPEFKNVKDVIKVRPQTPVFKILFQGRTTAVATADHLWPVISKGGWLNVRTDQLTNDHWIPKLEQFDIPSSFEELNIIEELFSTLTNTEMASWRIQGEGLVDVLCKNYEKIKQAALTEYTIQSVNQWKQRGMMPIKYWPLMKGELTDSQLYVGSGKQSGGLVQWLNARIALTRDLGFFLGFLLGDGSIGYTVRLAVGSEDHDLIEELCRIIPRIWNIGAKIYEEKRANMVNVQINSRALSHILKNIFGITGRAIKRTLSIPEIIWNSPIEVTQGFLAGLFAADGSIGTDRLFACFNTVQKSFAEEIGMLCTRAGLVYRLYTEGEMCKVELKDDRYVVLLESFGFMTSKHKEKIELHRKNRLQVRHNEWPTLTSGVVDLARKTRKTRNPRVTQRDVISKSVLTEKLEQIRDVSNKLSDEEIQHLERLEVLAEAPMHFTRVVKVKQLDKSPNYVYCLELDSSTPWFMIQGGIITHNCFGYLGFKNSRWGSIEGHQAVTAYGRKYLLEARLIAEKHGFEVIAGITDSLFIRPLRDELDNLEVVKKITQEITAETQIPIDLEGRFNWIVFGNVREYTNVAALNRYFGRFDHGEFKVRGIRIRQRRVTTMEREFQEELLELFAEAANVDEFMKQIPKSQKILYHWKKKLWQKEVDPVDLIIKLRSHVGSGNYKSRTQQALVTDAYEHYGKKISPGQSFKYIVRDDRLRTIDRITIEPHVTPDSLYDVKWYCDLLENVYLEIVESPQYQKYGKIIYSGKGVERDVNEWFERDTGKKPIQEGKRGSKIIEKEPVEEVKMEGNALAAYFA